MKRPGQSRHTMPHCIRLFLPLLLAIAPHAHADQLKRNSSGGRLNIIMFLIDDQNPSSIAAFGGDTYTPNLDRLAEEGMKFTRAYVSSSVCTPSRYSFLTGRFAGNSHSKLYAEAVGGKENQGLPNFNVALERDKTNVGNVLREAGYTTGFVGKFHLTSIWDFPEFYKRKDKWINIPKDAIPGPETSAQFKQNERWMRRTSRHWDFPGRRTSTRKTCGRPTPCTTRSGQRWQLWNSLKKTRTAPFTFIFAAPCSMALTNLGESPWTTRSSREREKLKAFQRS